MEWEELPGSSDIWQPKNKGEFIEGSVKEVRDTQYGKQIVILSANNQEFTTPSHKVLQARLSNVKVNEVVKIVFEGQDLPKVKGQSGTMLYKVFRAKQ